MRATTVVAVAAGILLATWIGWVALVGGFGHQPAHPAPPVEPSSIGYPWRGAVHVHTDLSADASGTLEEIVAAAAEAGLDYVVIADHTQAQGSATRVHPGWHGRVLVVVAEEISTDQGHLLALGLRAHPYALGPTYRQASRDVASLGGELIAAHPIGGETPWRGGVAGLTGLEVVSLSSALREQSLAGRLGALLVYPFSAEVAALRVLGRRPAALGLWDEMTRLAGNASPAPVVGIGAVDAHGPIGLGIPGYEAAFRSLSTVVWMDEPPGSGSRGAAHRLTARLLEGRAAIVLAAAGTAPELSFLARNERGEVVAPGQVARHDAGRWTLEAVVDDAADDVAITLYRDGETLASGAGTLEFDVDRAGTYRVEASREGGPAGGGRAGATPWIVTNPIFLWPDEVVAMTRARPAPALPAPPTGRSLLERTGWAAESGGEAMSALAARDDGLRWELRLPQEPGDDSYAALAWRPERLQDWSARRGLAVGVRSERPWRIALRVWTRTDGQQVTWEHVIGSEPDGAARAVPWSWLRRIDADGAVVGERLDEELAAVEGVVLVVTPQLMRAGEEAEIEILRLGLFGR